MRTVGVVVVALACVAAGGRLVSGLDATIHPPQPPAGLEAHETHASASLLGQFRTNVSAWLWVRTDLYLHNGVQMRPMTADERKSGVVAGTPADDGHEQLSDESSIVTVIPPKERDFRGLFGDVERATDTYKDMHSHVHNDPKLAMPLFRLMTWIDPQFIPGWTTGAMVIARDKEKAAQMQAVDYLRSGLSENPDSVAILADLGHLCASRLGDLPRAVEYLDHARRFGSEHYRELSDADQDALEQSYRWLGLCYRDLMRPTEMRQVLLEGLRLFPDDQVLLSIYSPPPTLLTPAGRNRWYDELSAELKAAQRNKR